MTNRLALALFVLAAVPAGAATYHVAPTGSGAACTLATPCRQIRTALLLVAPNDVVQVADGSYLGFDVDDIDGLPGQPITIRATGTNAVVTVTTDRPDNRDTIFITFSDWIVVEGLRASNANRAAVRIDQSHHVTVRNGVFANNGTWGIFTDFSDDTLLEGNTCSGSVGEHGIYVSNSSDRPIVRGNLLFNNAGAGLHMNGDLSAGGDGIISGGLVENNVIHGNGVGGGAGINLDGVHDTVVRNNVLYDNHATGIVAFREDGAQGPRGLQILHNTVDQASNGRWALQIFDTTGAILVRNNVLYTRHAFRGTLNYGNATDVANTDSDYNVLDRISPDGDATIFTLAQWQAQGHEPHSVVWGPLAALFVNANGGDYHLPAGSPAVDRGLTLPSVTVDIEGNPRPQGASSDAGAYERAGAPLPTLAIADTSVSEGNAGTTPASFTVTLSAAAAQNVTVAYASANGTATAPSDYAAASGTVTFPPGQTTRSVVVSVVGDTTLEPNETFTVSLSSPAGATIADGQATGTIQNDDLPVLAVADASVTEGTGGTTPASFVVTLSAASAQNVTVGYATASGTATSPADFTAASGIVTFPPSTTARTVVVSVVGDAAVEGDEAFTVALSAPSGATIADGQATGTIVDDDLPPTGGLELSHGAVFVQDLSSATGPAGSDTYRIAQQARASYEVVVDAASGDVSPAVLERLAANLSTVLQTGDAVGTATGRSLRWMNTTTMPVVNQAVRVRSTGCGTDCGADDTYRVRAWETTYAVPRFNQSGTQGTVLVVQNRTTRTVSARAYFWSPAGILLAESTFTLGARATQVLNVATVAGLSGQSGSLTIAHDGGYGALAGKAVALEPSTGFSFDSPMTERAP
jgi:parallel beta-helix repeat protein